MGITESGHNKGIFLSNRAKVVTKGIYLNCHFLFSLFLLYNHIFLNYFLLMNQITIIACFYFMEYTYQGKVDFGCAIKFFVRLDPSFL